MEIKFKNKEHRILWGLVVYSFILGILVFTMLAFLNTTINDIDNLVKFPYIYLYGNFCL